MRVLSAIVVVALGGVAACAPPARVLPAAAAAVPPRESGGALQQCVELSRIREAKVVDDRTIDFILSDRRVLRNTLPNACPQLGFERAFSYSTALSRLCSVDIVTIIVQGAGPQRGASCGLGPFVPYTPPAK